MVDAVLLVLREVLEAALIISLLLALTRKLHLQFRWMSSALGIGFFSSWLLARYAYEIADAIDGMGQEIVNAFCYLVVIVGLVGLVLRILPLAFMSLKSDRHSSEKIIFTASTQGSIYILFILTVCFSLAREGSEIWIYLSSFTHHSGALSSALIGAAIGAGIGMSLGAITYYVFVFMPGKYFLPIFILVLTLVSGGLSMQIAKQLMQVGLLDSGVPLWDSSGFVNEHSWVGELLYALLGYDARPTPIQGIFYLLSIAPLVIASIWFAWRGRVNINA
jgi:high-affinity iron transporter